jgi:hypothetical protein
MMKLPRSVLAWIMVGWAGTAGPAAAQIGVGVSVGGTSVGVEVGSGGGSATVSTGGGGSSGNGNAVDNSTETPSPQDVALEAVRTDRALPLEQIVARAQQLSDGQVIDARLITVRGFLLYELKVLEATGDVVDLYFYARSGEVVRAQQ